MSMKEWAKREIEIVCEKSNEDNWYYSECCKSALKAFETLCGDGHSGMSIQMTKAILNKLIDGVALTPIEDTDDMWSDKLSGGMSDEYVTLQCVRKTSLFKDIYKDGTVRYNDVDRVICIDVNNENHAWTNGRISRLINDMYPIEFPYEFKGKYKVYCEEFLVDEKNGDFDTVGVLYVILPGGEKVDINQYTHEVNGEMVEVPKNIYDKLKRMAEKRLNNLKK